MYQNTEIFNRSEIEGKLVEQQSGKYAWISRSYKAQSEGKDLVLVSEKSTKSAN